VRPLFSLRDMTIVFLGVVVVLLLMSWAYDQGVVDTDSWYEEESWDCIETEMEPCAT